MNNNNSNSILRVVVGGYLIYLAYGLFKDLRAGTIDKPALFVAAMIFFVAAGGVIIFFGIKGMREQSQTSADEVADEALNEELEIREELDDVAANPALTKGKMAGINKELDKLKQADKAAEKTTD